MACLPPIPMAHVLSSNYPRPICSSGLSPTHCCSTRALCMGHSWTILSFHPKVALLGSDITFAYGLLSTRFRWHWKALGMFHFLECMKQEPTHVPMAYISHGMIGMKCHPGRGRSREATSSCGIRECEMTTMHMRGRHHTFHTSSQA